ncbi:MAG: chorismate synthase [Actinomycetota bacterium]
MRWLTAGESHGPALIGIIEGVPAGVSLTTTAIQSELARRRLGFGRGARQKFEEDQVTIKSGVRHGLTQGGPISIEIANTEWPKWEKVMATDPVDAVELEGLARNEPLSRPRPGHADLVGMQKYNFTDARPILERASARETAMRVALSVVARELLREVAGVEIFSHVVSIGKVKAENRDTPSSKDRESIDASPVRAASEELSDLMVAEIESAHREGDTLGGVFEVVVENCPIGLGSHVHWDRRIDSRLAGAIMGIQAIKGVEIGDGFTSASRRGSEAHDEIERIGGAITRQSNRAGGTEGGMTTGERLRVRGAMKPISTVPKALSTIDVATGESAKAINQRSDVCAVPAAGVIGESMVALVLAEALLEKFGGDHIEETKRNFQSFLANISIR